MNELMIFENEQFGNIRAMEKGGQPWFVAADVCRALEIANVGNALARLDDDEKGSIRLTDVTPNGGNPNLSIVNEPGLYSLILGSRKPEAKAFKRWITHQVLPSIRKTGGYLAGSGQLSPEELLAQALLVARRTLDEREARISALTVENQIMQPKAAYFDQLVDRNLLTSFRDTAKALGVGPKAFVAFLLHQKYLYRDKKGKLLPYEDKNNGLFEVKECFNEKTQWSGVQTMITPKGRETFRLLYTNGI